MLQQKLEKAQRQMKIQADKKCCDAKYVVNDWVYVQLLPCCQFFLTDSSYLKMFVGDQCEISNTKKGFIPLMNYLLLPMIIIHSFKAWLYYSPNGITLLFHLKFWYWSNGRVLLLMIQAGRNGITFVFPSTLRTQ